MKSDDFPSYRDFNLGVHFEKYLIALSIAHKIQIGYCNVYGYIGVFYFLRP